MFHPAWLFLFGSVSLILGFMYERRRKIILAIGIITGILFMVFTSQSPSESVDFFKNDFETIVSWIIIFTLVFLLIFVNIKKENVCKKK